MVDKHKVSLLQQQLQVQLGQHGDAWRIDNLRLFGFPAILPDEIFSSWIWRALASGRITKEQLAKLWKIKHPSYWIDGNSNLLNFERISKTLSTTPTNVLDSTVWPIQANLSHSQTLCLTADILGKRPIYRYCPDCFREDAIAYIRKNWRLAFTYICKVHSRLMEDSCPKCHQHLNLERFGPHGQLVEGVLSIRYCLSCGHDLSHFSPRVDDVGHAEALLKAQTMLEQHTVDQNAYASAQQLSLSFERDDTGASESMAGFHLHALSEFLMRFRFYDGKTMQSISAGLCGPKVFGEDADRIGSFFSKNRLFQNTYWFSGNTIYHAFNPKILKGANKWIKKL